MPLVTVICLCYKHAPFVRLALDSVLAQTYAHVELIIIDDCSPDDSVQVIRQWLNEQKQTYTFLALEPNIGNCAAFNRGLSLAKGQYIIDLAADDVLLPNRIASQVALLETNPTAAATYSDALLIDEKGKALRTHYLRDKNGALLQPVPSGAIYQRLFEGHFVCSVTLMFRTETLRQISGYDETLAYEDFDVLMRLARTSPLLFQDQILTQYRVVQYSLSSKFYQRKQNKMLESTLVICQKAMAMHRQPSEVEAWAIFVRYHLRQAFFTENFYLVEKFGTLLKYAHRLDFTSKLILTFSRFRPKIYFMYNFYIQLKKIF